MTGLRQYWWCLIVPVVLVGGAVSVLSPAGTPKAVARAHDASQGGLNLQPVQVEAAGGGHAAASAQAQEAPHSPAVGSHTGRQAPKAAQLVRTTVGQGVSALPAGQHLQAVAVTPVTYAVALSQDAVLPGPAYTVRGFSYTSPGAKEVVLLLHGFSFGYREWDFPAVSPDPQNPYTYSTARYLAAHGTDAIAIDQLGVGSSDRPDFVDALQLTIPAYASMTHQIVQSLRAHYTKVVTVGASSGGEIASLEAGRYRDVDGIVDAGFCDLPLFSADLVTKELGPTIDGLTQPYVYFGGTTQGRDGLEYNTGDADPAVIAKDDTFIEPIAASTLHTIELQPAKAFDPLVNVPVLVAFGGQDPVWLPACSAPAQAMLYLSSPSVSTFVLPGAGHNLTHHLNAGAFESELFGWLKDH
jgi:pimeloyl-ACP methyl ester carboxylesterase